MKNYLHNLINLNGAISISQFMNEALFHPKFGYYKQQNPFGKEGDFITAPEISQVFGELIGAYLAGIWQNNYSDRKINLVEMGAGKGTLMKDLLGVFKQIPRFLEIVKISIIEISPKLQEVQKRNLQEFKIEWYENFADFYEQNQDAPIFFISNELFDCFAINQFIKTANGWAERMITVDDNDNLVFTLQTIPKEAEMPLKKAKYFDRFPNGQKINNIFEESPQAISFMKELSQTIKKTGGIGLIIDYGYLENEIENYPFGTLQSLKNHQYSDVLKDAGNCDITALVNFSALKKIAEINQLQTSLISQKEFLNGIGIELRRKKLLQNKSTNEKEKINSAIDRLIDKRQMGELFKVLIFW